MDSSITTGSVTVVSSPPTADSSRTTGVSSAGGNDKSASAKTGAKGITNWDAITALANQRLNLCIDIVKLA